MDQLDNIQNLIYVIRGQRVMLDFDLGHTGDRHQCAIGNSTLRASPHVSLRRQLTFKRNSV